jgi:Leucine-rich repeat (LRR) protein
LNNFGLLSIPEDVFSCSGIKELDLSNNLLTEIPSKLFANSPEIERLSIRNNKIKILPENIEILKSLKVLNISSNEIKSLPKSIINLLSLKIIILEENPLEEPPLEIAVQGIEVIKKWFENESKISFYEDKPDWVKQAAYAMLHCQSVIANEGEFTDKDFRIIWPNKHFTKSDYDRLIELKKKMIELFILFLHYLLIPHHRK